MYSPLFTHLFRHTRTVTTPEMQRTFGDSTGYKRQHLFDFSWLCQFSAGDNSKAGPKLAIGVYMFSAVPMILITPRVSSSLDMLC